MTLSVRAGRPVCRSAWGRVALWAMAVLCLALTGCGEKKKDKPSSQTAARVNSEDITVHQINFVLQQQRGLPPEQAASAAKAVLERLIDQELAVQKALEQKVDRDPRVAQQLDAARREIIARAYAERIGAGVSKPSPEEIKAYYDAHPALFKERRVYTLQELSIQAKPDQIDTLRAKLAGSKDVPDFINYLKANDFKFSANQAVRAAEQLPMASVDKIAQMKDGHNIFNAVPLGAQVLVLVSSRAQPVDEAQATPAIEQFLMKTGASPALAPEVSVPDVPHITVAPPTAVPAASVPAAAQELETVPASAASGPSTATLEKGLKGIK